MQRQTPRSGLVRVVNPGLKRGPHTPKNYQDKGKSPNIFQAFWQKFYQNSSNQMTLEFLLEFFQILQKIRNLLLLWQNSNETNWQIPKKWMLALFLILMHFMFGTPQLLLSFRFSSKYQEILCTVWELIFSILVSPFFKNFGLNSERNLNWYRISTSSKNLLRLSVFRIQNLHKGAEPLKWYSPPMQRSRSRTCFRLYVIVLSIQVSKSVRSLFHAVLWRTRSGAFRRFWGDSEKPWCGSMISW